jgi:DNA polymerase III epsilon subunit-like protein
MASDAGEAGYVALELRDRAVRFLTERSTSSDDEVLAHVYGGPLPSALRARFAAPLLVDPRLERSPAGIWMLRGHAPVVVDASTEGFTALTVVATGPTPERASVARVVALKVGRDGTITDRFDALLNPMRRVPGYALVRLGADADVLDAQPVFASVVDELTSFLRLELKLGNRPLLAQDAALTWGFVDAEARRLQRVLPPPALLDVNDLATRVLDRLGKPSLSLVASHLGISFVHIERADEEARVLALVGARLLAMAAATEWSVSVGSTPTAGARPLRRGATARSLPDDPGVYVLRDGQQVPLYVGKARRLRSRVLAYVHRPLGPTRRFEGLVAAVDAVDTTPCATDLEALILEDREIRRLQPRFNTVRRQRTPRYWIRLPPTRTRALARGRKPPAPPRLELSSGPADDVEGEFVGPFRNEMLADQARRLVRDVFELDGLRRTDPARYTERLAMGWWMLRSGGTAAAEPLARRRSRVLLRRVLAFDVAALLLPADPRAASFVVLRPDAPTASLEGFRLDHALLCAWARLEEPADVSKFVRTLLAPNQPEPRTSPADVDVVLRWLGAQRPPTRLLWLPETAPVPTDAIETAALELLPREA